MFNRSIAYRLSIYISLAVGGVFMAFIIIIFIYNQRIVKKSIEDEANKISAETVGLVHQQLNATQEISNNLAEQIIYYAEHKNAEFFLESIMKKYSFINAIYIDIDHNNDLPPITNYDYFIYRNSDSLKLSSGNDKIFHCEVEKEIFKTLELKNDPAWSNAYQCGASNGQIISFYSPIKLTINKETVIKVGSVICELSLKTLNDTINSIKIRKNGFAFLINDKGTFLTHPNKDWIFNRNIFSIPEKSFDSEKPDIQKIFKEKLSGSIVGYPEYLNYKKCWVHYTPIIETGWFLLVLVPYDELYFPLYTLILRMLFFAVLGVLVIFFIVTYISNRQIQPLSKVTTQLKRFSSLSGENELNTLNEVKIVSESLNYIRAWYEKFKINQYQEEKLNSQRKQDLLEASEIQMSLINTDFSGFKKRNDIDLYAIYKPARIVSGDLFDFFFLDGENLFFTIGDVSGKGISAAFFMSVAQTIIKANAKLRDPAKIVSRVNKELTTTNQHQFFLTLFLGVLNLKTGVLNYCNAAHTSTVVLKPSSEIIELSQSHGLPLGLYPDKIYSGASLQLESGDTIWLFTDGVTELQNEENEHFGKERLNNKLILLSEKTPTEIIESVEIALENFKGKAKQSDDITMMAINYKGKKKA